MPDAAPVPPRGDGVRRALVVVPTYNEVESLPTMLTALLGAPGDFDVLVVDDASPDGTGDLADRLAAQEPRISVLHRAGKDGLGRAYLSGFHQALDAGYDVVVEMDADGSHPASQVHELVHAAMTEADLVVGSRWVPGGRVVDWSRARQALSRGGNRYARIVLGLPVRDSTSGFRAYRAELLRRLPLDDVESRGYCFQIDMTLRSVDAGASIREIPIVFREREQGTSKMSRSIVAEAMLRVTWWGLRRRLRGGTARAGSRSGAHPVAGRR
ncbi:polyprenol monophosphomannose synthase [Herbiconiux sp. L3-i23]|uniref:polyprenol monophosphomannose synthase n=1 Tax=Herbiconiux sp. L3-i23 TaxID=2905871 RepID=UPI00204E9CCD|nr:polyprenol monophosphomannose synthase [Herbiconiux sp. L3-i23]BDI21597.1 dolichol-phosphate mannosyltransferase [Herbiconiux sp. L3-i23]